MTLPDIVSPFKKTNWSPADYYQMKEGSLKTELKENGYVVLRNFFSAEIVSQLEDLYNSNEHRGKNHLGMFMSIYSPDTAYRLKVHAAIKRIVTPAFNSIFTDYRVPVFNYIVKSSQANSELPIHQDLPLVDENFYSMIGIWSPLCKVTADNGTYCLIPKSHFLIPPHRTSYSESVLTSLSGTLRQYMQPIIMNPGDLLLFDSRIIHYSTANISGKDRVVIGATIFPEAAELNFLYKNPSNVEYEFDVLKVHEERFFEVVDFESANSAPIRGELSGKIIVDPIQISEDQVHAYCRQCSLSTPISATRPQLPVVEKQHKKRFNFIEVVSRFRRILADKKFL